MFLVLAIDDGALSRKLTVPGKEGLQASNLFFLCVLRASA
jgi:hypothetical protein